MPLSRRSFLIATGSSIAFTQAQGQTRARVNLISTQGAAGLAVQQLALDMGFFSEFNLEPKFTAAADANRIIAALRDGSSDLCVWSGLGAVPVAIEKGAPLRIVAGAIILPAHVIYTGKPGIAKASDLKGKTIGIGPLGAQLHQEMLAYLKKAGVAASDVTFKNVGNTTDVFKAVADRTVDAGPGEVDGLENLDRFKLRALDDGKLWERVPEFTPQAAYATLEAIAQKKENLINSLAAMRKTYLYLQSANSKDAWIKAYRTATKKEDPAEALGQWSFIQQYKPYARDLVLGPDKVQFMQQLNVELGLQGAVLPYEQVADMSLAQAAVKKS